MKRLFLLSTLTIMTLTALTGCGKSDNKEETQAQEEVDQVIEEEVTDYSALNFQELEVLAYGDDPVAQYMLGQQLEYGTEDVNQDLEQAYDWYSKAAAHDHADATAAVGYFYLTGTVVDQDVDTALSYFDQAVLLGSVDGKVGRGRALMEELPEESTTEEESEDTDSDTTVEEEAGDTESELAEADQSYSDTETEIFNLFKAAQMTGSVDGSYYLGLCYEKGIGCQADMTKAINFYEKAASATSQELPEQYGINLANVTVGLRYMNGEGVEADQKKALEYFTVAADNNFPSALYYLGQAYENGLGVEQDYEKAMEYYMSAAESDYAPALNQIGYLYYNGYGVDVDFSSAVYYQKLAALQGYAPAQVNLGFLYENGFGVERNLNTALSYYQLAADTGYEGAFEAVVRVTSAIGSEAEPESLSE